ncbi:MAG: hypothetical protein M1318_04810 [Firmicutes bacterium]|nr:hypothetical protein [Bacillota bacterium]
MRTTLDSPPGAQYNPVVARPDRLGRVQSHVLVISPQLWCMGCNVWAYQPWYQG